MTEKEKFLRRINEAFAKSDMDFIIQNVTDDIVWNIVSDKMIRGKKDLMRELRSMKNEQAYELNIANIITHGRSASVNGTMKMTDPSGKEQVFAFCDIYQFSSFKNPKIKEMTSYVIELIGIKF